MPRIAIPYRRSRRSSTSSISATKDIAEYVAKSNVEVDAFLAAVRAADASEATAAIIKRLRQTHTALWHLFSDGRLSAAAAAFISDAATARRRIAISTIKFGGCGLFGREEPSPSVYAELTRALADPEHVFTEAVN